MPLSLALLGLLGCATAPDAVLLADALSAGSEAGLALCDQIVDGPIADECRASLVRADVTLDDDAAAAACAAIADPRWGGECWFTLAERRIVDGPRWPALEACGRAGPYYDECLYHLWTAELSAIAAAAPTAVAAAAPAEPVVAFWSGLQTVRGDPEDQLWGDLWFFAWNEHRPADLQACDGLDGEPARRCRQHTADFAHRAVLGALLSPAAPAGLLDRTCRSGAVPGSLVEGLVVPHPEFDAQLAEVPDLACAALRGEPVRRYNPVFQERRPPQEAP